VNITIALVPRFAEVLHRRRRDFRRDSDDRDVGRLRQIGDRGVRL
jgi:hypothetical protein